MLSTDRAAVICDFAEIYRIYDIYQFRATYIATLASGLDADSRIGKKLNGIKADTKTLLLAKILDCWNLYLWANSEKPKRNKMPESYADLFIEGSEKEKPESMTVDEFEMIWAQRTKGN